MYINNLKNWIVQRLIPKGTLLVNGSEYAEREIELHDCRHQLKVLAQEPLPKEHLTMKQLGSYVPSFEQMSTQTDAFKTVLAQLCYQLSISKEWKYLIDHLKQDQVNLYLFTEERKSEDFMRGSINGIYVVDEQIRLLGSGYKTPEPPPTQSEK